jgi:hypothetical protein
MLKAIFNIKDGEKFQGSSVLLDGTKSTEADTYQWRVLGVQEHNQDKFKIHTPDKSSTLVDGLVPGKYYFELTVWPADKTAHDVEGAHVTVEN